MSVRITVVGATGYSGAELIGLALGHPSVEIADLFASGRGTASTDADVIDLAALFGRFRGSELSVRATDLGAIVAGKPDAVLLATPHEVSHELAPALLREGIVVLDLSGAFRLGDPGLYPAHYGFSHAHPEWLAAAAYGLPELNRAFIAGADLIAVPGCYPTSAILPLRPLVDAGVVAGGAPVVIDATSGVSGAGRAPALKTHFCEVSLQPYSVLGHRHEPEIVRHAGTDVVFTPHLGAFDRGILSTIHVTLAGGVGERDVRAILGGAYRGEPFVRILPLGTWPALADVRRTNFCDVGLALDEGRRHLVLASAIDNLVKGAAGQALQCLNVRFGLAETEGLPGEAACSVA